MKKNSANSTTKINKVEKARQEALHGDFFFAEFFLSDGLVRRSPVFVIGNDGDTIDVIVCKCTTQPAKSDFDVKIQLKMETYVRTNKIYTIGRNQLLFKIGHEFESGEYERIIEKLKKALNL